MVTERQAQKLYCPQTFGRGAGSTCIGSKCMAWRWAISPAQAAVHANDRHYHLAADGVDYGEQPATGLCGLAGPA